jgi:hypothetical protein
MGDKSLMKKIFLLLSLTVLVNADLSVEQIQKMVLQIHEKREGVQLATLENTKDPFIQLYEDEENNVTTFTVPENEEAKLVLHAIVNGKAYINDSWSSPDETVMGYTVKYIGPRGVVLRNGNHVKKLFLHEKRDNFIKLEERL